MDNTTNTNFNPLDDIDMVDFSQYLVDVTKDVKDKQYHFFLNGVGFSPLGNVQAIKAKPKNGKTQFTKILMAAAIVGECMGITCYLENSKVLWIDTEQDPDDAIRVMQGALKLCSEKDSNYKYNEPSDRYVGLSLRIADTDTRRKVVRKAIEHYKPTLVIIDGVRDLVHDFNDLAESAEMVGELMTLSTQYNCAIWSILHENKGDGNMRGHLGTELANKVTDVLQIVKEKDPISGEISFKVEQTEARGKDIEKYDFHVDDWGNPCVQQMGNNESNELRNTMQLAHAEMLRVLDAAKSLDPFTKAGKRKADFIEALIAVADVKKSHAYNLFNRAVQQGIIYVDVVTKNIHITNDGGAGTLENVKKNEEAPF